MPAESRDGNPQPQRVQPPPGDAGPDPRGVTEALAARMTNPVATTMVMRMAMGLRQLGTAVGTGIVDFCFPPTCAFCLGDLSHRGRVDDNRPGGGLCHQCRRLIEAVAIPHGCHRCGIAIPNFAGTSGPVSRQRPGQGDGESQLIGIDRVAAKERESIDESPAADRQLRLCASCAADSESGPLGRLFVLGAYREILREGVIACKRSGFVPLASNLGQLLALRIASETDVGQYAAVTHVPSHWTRRLRRGNVPARELAAAVARQLRIPLLPLLVNRRRTAKQGTLSDADRKVNVRGAFAVKKGYALNRRRVLVIDDVWTTGSTLREAAERLSVGYRVEVDAGVVARAVGTHRG
jgi:predicted amidophosphoribosyltransferase